MGEWQEATLGDVCELKRGYDLPSAAREPGDVPIVSSSGITGFHAIPKVKGPGVVTGRYGTLGEVFFVETDFWPLNTALYVRDFKGNEPRFVAALLQTLDLARSDGAAAVPGVNRNHLHLLPVRRPDLDTQRAISSFLAAVDGLIENSRRRIALLNDVARTIFEDAFAGSRSEEEIDESIGSVAESTSNGWTTRNLFDIADVAFGFSFKSNRFADTGPYPVVRIRDVPSGTTKTFTDEQPPERYRVRDGDVLVGMDGDFHLRQWSGSDAWLNQRVARITPRISMSGRHLMLALQRPIAEWNASISGTTVAHLGKRHLEKIEILVPPDDILANATECFDSLASAERALLQSTRRLTELRRVLLPKLLTGQLEIGDVEQAQPRTSVA